MGKEFNIEDYLNYINADEIQSKNNELEKLPIKYQKLRDILKISDDNFLDLIHLKDDLDIEEKEFFIITIFSKRYLDSKMKNNGSLEISEEFLCEVIKDSLMNTDYDIIEKPKGLDDSFLKKRKTPEEAFLRAIKNLDFLGV